MDKLAGLQAFVAVVEHGGFAAAARRLGVTRAAVNRNVQNLEDALGVRLLQRTTRKVTPTEQGLAYFDRCIRILGDLEEADAAVMELHTKAVGPLRVNGPMSFGSTRMAPMVADFMKRWPDVFLQVTLSDRFVDPIEEGFDVTVRLGERLDCPSIISKMIRHEERLLCASPDYLAKAPPLVTAKDLTEHKVLSYGHLSGEKRIPLIYEGREQKVKVRDHICANNGEILSVLADAGLGVVMLPEFIICDALEQGRLVRVLPDYDVPGLWLQALYPRHRHLSAKVRLFVDMLVEWFGGEQSLCDR